MSNISAAKINAQLERAFNPASIAVLGASADKAKMGGRVLSAILTNGFRGDVYPINPRGGDIQGRPAFPTLAAIGKPVDLVVICVPQNLVEESAIAAGEAGAKAVVVFASGYAEKDAEGAEAQERLVAIARRHGFSLIGPNCLGLINGAIGLAATSSIMMDFMQMKGGRLALVTQSGALGAYWLDEVLAAGLGVGKWVSTGNEAQTSLAALMNYLVEDAGTDIASAYLEGMRDGIAFSQALANAAVRRKPVILLRSGRSAAGARAVASHTGSLAGEDDIATALVAQYGACQVDSITEMVDLARVFSSQKVVSGGRTCIISISGGAGALLADAASKAGLTLPDLPPDVVAELQTFFPSYAKLANPIDLTDQVTRQEDMVGRTLEAVMRSGAFDTLLVFVSGRNPKALADYKSAAIKHLPGWKGNHLLVWKSGERSLLRDIQSAGVAIFDDIAPAVRALGRAVAAARRWDALAGFTFTPVRRSAEGASYLSEQASKRFLAKQAGLPVPASVLVRDPGEVESALAQLVPPFAVKLQSPDMLHKSGHGGIALGLADAASVRAEVVRMASLARDKNLRFEGVLIEQMSKIEHEFILGLRIDPTFGPLLVFGRGGVAVEVDPDVVRGFLPLDAKAIAALIQQLRLYPLLQAFRGRPAISMDALAGTIQRLSALFLQDKTLAEIEINPLAIDERGNILALDALVATTGSTKA